MRAIRIWREKWGAFSYYLGRESLLMALMRWAVWAFRCILKRPAIVEMSLLGIHLYLRPRWKGCWKAIFVFRDRFFDVSDPELEFVRRSLESGGVFVDVGAYHGWYTLVASRAVGPRGRVLAFEPHPETYDILVRNVGLNRCANVQTFEAALLDADGDAWLYKSPSDGVYSALVPVKGWEGRAWVTARRFDSIAEEVNLPAVDLMKVDVQGAEASVFRGAVRMLTTWRPGVIFEVDLGAARDMGVSVREGWDFLAGLGYRFFTFSAGSLVPLPDFPALQEGKFVNVVAVHDDRPGRATHP